MLSKYRVFRQALNNQANNIHACYYRFLIQPVKYRYMLYRSFQRNNRNANIFIFAVKGIFLSYLCFAAIGVIDLERGLYSQQIKTEYTAFVMDTREKPQDYAIQSVHVLLDKAKSENGLTSMQILALNDLIKRQELNIHGEYLASLK